MDESGRHALHWSARGLALAGVTILTGLGTGFRLHIWSRRIGCWPALFALACGPTPPHEHGTFRDPDLIEVTSLDSTVRLDIRYATSDNFLGRPVYAAARAFLQRPAAEALVRVHRRLRTDGYGLLVFDAYRPWSVTKLFWDETPPEKRDFVADPQKGSVHNRGCAVDLSLADLTTAAEVAMPSAYDEFSVRAYPDYRGGTDESRRLRDLLRRAMEAEGFAVYQFEWWHFDYTACGNFRILDIPFADVPRPRGPG